MQASARTRVCIYCLRDRPLSDYRKRDHVMPRAFGRFTPVNPTLDCVCDECNGYFGDTIEREMGRDSLEALLRVLNRTKPASEAHELRQTRSRMTLEHEDPEWKGCHLVWSDDDGEPVASLVPQVGFRLRDGEGWVYVLEKDLEDTDKPLPPEADEPRKGMRLVSSSQETTERLISILARRGVSFEKTRQTEGRLSSADGMAQVILHGTVDETSFRCVGKIAFNYLAWRSGADFVRLDTFNGARAFIRYGTVAPYPVVRADRGSMLHGDTGDTRRTDAHLVAAAWTLDNKHLVGQVSLFNSLTYFVQLSRDFVGVWRPLVTGHYFDHRTGKITLLVNTMPR